MKENYLQGNINCDRELLSEIINKYDMIYVISTAHWLCHSFIEYIYMHNINKSLLFILNVEAVNAAENNGFDVVYWEEETVNELLKTYYMYEFSHKIRVLTIPEQYGSLDNYLLNGLLTEEEYFKALLC